MGSLAVGTNGRGFRAGPVLAAYMDRSPKDSPPIAKKKVCRLGGSSPARGSPPAQFTFDQPHPGVESRDPTRAAGASIISASPSVGRAAFSKEGSPSQRTSPTGTLRQTSSILRTQKGRSRGWLNKARRVHFSPTVTVFRMDEDGPICTEKQGLNTEPRDKQAFMARWLNKVQQQRMQAIDQLYEESAPAPPLPPRVPPTTPAPTLPQPNFTKDLRSQVSTYTCNSSSDQPDGPSSPAQPVNFSFVEDPQEGVKLRFVLSLGSDYQPEDIVVKANTSGNRIRVIANRVRYSGGCQVVEQFNERYHIPMQVEPHLVTARLDVKGNLTVLAPLLTQDRRQAPIKGPAGRHL